MFTAVSKHKNLPSWYSCQWSMLYRSRSSLWYS